MRDNEKQPYDIEDQLPAATVTKRGNLFQTASEIFVEYCSYSSIHGVKYFGERRRHWIERCWWIISFLISVYCCGALIYKIYSKWNRSAVIVSFADELTPVWHIPFPAVTICPTTKVNLTQMNITEALGKAFDEKQPPFDLNDEEFNLFKAATHICEPLIGNYLGKLGLGNITNSSIKDLLMRTAPTLNDTIYDNTFPNDDNVAEFHEIMTEEGLCFTFNMLNGSETYTNDISPDHTQIRHDRRSYWNLEKGYDPDIKDNLTYPYRVAGSGADRDKLNAWLESAALHWDSLCRGPIQGYSIVLHVPGEIPQVSKYFSLIPVLQVVSVAVKANIIKTSEGLRDYSYERRKCYFDSERKLRFLKVYTQRNCELECLSNDTLHKCGCVQFSLPRDASTPVCGTDKISCYNSVRNNLLRANISPTSVNRPCNCLPACNSITYDAEISQNPFDWNSYSKSLKLPRNESDEYKPTRFQVYFKENEFITLTRSELYGPIDFIASCGGLLGLFMGASFLSIVELLYFCFLRLCCNIRTNRKQEAASTVQEEKKKEGEERIDNFKEKI